MTLHTKLLAISLFTVFGLWACSDSSDSSMEQETETVEIDTKAKELAQISEKSPENAESDAAEKEQASVESADKAETTQASEGEASVYFISPKDGEKLDSPVRVKIGAKGVEIVPAGTDQENSGHHHIVVDSDLPDLTEPMGSEVIHLGSGQTEASIVLAPGQHTLQILLGDKDHIAHDPAIYSEKITITVLNNTAE